MASTNEISQLTPQAVYELMKAGRARLHDVREEEEHRAERIAGARLTPLSRLDPRAFASTGEELVVVHCKSGKRGQDACNRLVAADCRRIAHMQGGIEAWKAAGLPVEAGTPSKTV